MSHSIVYIENDNLIQLTGLQDAATSVYVNNATVTVTVTDRKGVNVSGQSWPLTLSYVASSNGNYEGTLEDGLVLSIGQKYEAKVVADAGSDKIATWYLDLMAQRRT